MIDMTKVLPAIEHNQRDLDDMVIDLVLDIDTLGAQAAATLLAMALDREHPAAEAANMIALTALYRLACEYIAKRDGVRP